MMKPQDIVALVGLQVLLRNGETSMTLSRLAAFTRLSVSETHAAIGRLEYCQLLQAMSADLRRPAHGNFLEFAEHGLRYVFPPEFGPPTRGLPTAAAMLPGMLAPLEPHVWPLEQGGSHGVAIQPLYRSVPAACLTSQPLHVAMAALDALRLGRPRERQLALSVLREVFAP